MMAKNKIVIQWNHKRAINAVIVISPVTALEDNRCGWEVRSVVRVRGERRGKGERRKRGRGERGERGGGRERGGNQNKQKTKKKQKTMALRQ
jgi:hypothetical protein